MKANKPVDVGVKELSVKYLAMYQYTKQIDSD